MLYDRPVVTPAPQPKINWLESYSRGHVEHQIPPEMFDSMYQQQIDPNVGLGNVDNSQLQSGNISVDAIEDAVLQLFDKYKVSDLYGKIPAKNEISVEDFSPSSVPTTKTFTLDEIINLINSMHTESIHSQAYWNTDAQNIRSYIDKNEFIQILRKS
jgi:hypothetical protein